MEKTRFKVGQKVRYCGQGRYWRDKSCHKRIGKIILVQPAINNICVKYKDTKGKEHIDNLRMDDEIAEIEVLRKNAKI